MEKRFWNISKNKWNNKLEVECTLKTNQFVQFLGIYEVKSNPDVLLIEMLIKSPLRNINVSAFTQRNDSLPEDSWQAAYDEHFLNEDGTRVIGNFADQSNVVGEETRIAFFMYDVDVSKPLMSQYGDISLSIPTPMPERLAKIIDFEPVD